MPWKNEWQTIFWPEFDSGGLSLTRDQVALRIFDNFESPATTGTISAAWTGTNVTVTRETTFPLNGEGSMKVVVAGGAGSVYHTLDRAKFGYPFPGHNSIRIRYVKFRATDASGSDIRVTFGDASDANHYRYWTKTIGNSKYAEYVVDLDPDNTESNPAPTTGSTTWDPETADRFGFTNLTSGNTYYFDDIHFIYEYSLPDLIGFPTEAPVAMGDIGTLHSRINGLWSDVKALEGQTQQYTKQGVSSVEVGDSATWALELLSDFAPPATTTEIEPGTYKIDRIRHGDSAEIVAATAASEATGTIYASYQPEENNWTEGDLLKVTFANGYIRTDELPTEVLTVNATAGNAYVDVDNAYQWQVGWLVRVYDDVNGSEWLTISELTSPTKVTFSGNLSANHTTANNAGMSRAIRTDLTSAVFYTRISREATEEFRSISWTESDREDGAHTQVGDNVHWDFQSYSAGGGTPSSGISGGKINLSIADAGDYAARNLYAQYSKYFRWVVDISATFTSMGVAGGRAGMTAYKGTAYDANNFVQLSLYEDNVPNDTINAYAVFGGAGIANVDVTTADDAVALMIERIDRTWRMYYSLTQFPDYEWVLITEADDASDNMGEVSSPVLFVSAGNAGATAAGAFGNFKEFINSKFLEQIYNQPEIIPVIDKQADPRVDQNTATGIEIFRIGLINANNGLPVDAEITPGTTLVDRFREGTDTDWTNQAGETITNLDEDGYVYALYDFPNATWQPGDQARMRISGVIVTDTITGRAVTLPSLSIYFIVGGPPNADYQGNLWIGDVIGNKTDVVVPIVSAVASQTGYQKALVARGMTILRAKVTTGGSPTTVVSTDLIGFGDNFFNNQFYMQVVQSGAAVPEPKVRKITDYTSNTGSFVVDTFTDNVDTGDDILIMHESLVAIGRDDADNVFSSATVVANVDGSLLERSEALYNAVLNTWYTAAAQRSLADMPYLQIKAFVMERPLVAMNAATVVANLILSNERPDSDVIQVAEITNADIDIKRYRYGTDAGFATTAVSDADMTAVVGGATYAYTFPSASWASGDLIQYTIRDVTVVIAGQTFTVPSIVLYGVVDGAPAADVSTNVWPADVIGSKTDAIPAMNAAPANSSLVAQIKAVLERVGATPNDSDDSLLTIAGQRDDGVTVAATATIVSLLRNIHAALNIVASGAGGGFEIDGDPGLVTALGTTGAVVSDSATSVLGAIGANNANNAFDSSLVAGDDDGSVLEREEYIQTQLGYGVRELTETAGGSTTVITAVGITEAAGWWKNALIIGITGANIGVARPVISNTVGTITVYPALRAANVIADKFLLISGYKGQAFEQQADVPVSVTALTTPAEADVFDLTATGFSYMVNSLRLKCADPGANTVTVRLYELINDAEVNVASHTITTTNYGSYFSLMDMFGVNNLAGDNIRVTVSASASTYTVLGQYNYSMIYTGAG